jgi:phosphoribosylanthranilate isomerase
MVLAIGLRVTELAWHRSVAAYAFLKNMQTWIKICGTTSVYDALASIEAGADALGFIFAPSKRQITPAAAQEIIQQLPHEVEKIGVFMDAGAHNIAQVVEQVDLTGIQMHGEADFPPEVYGYVSVDRRDSMRKIKTVMVQEGFQDRLDALMPINGVVDAVLLDSGAGSGRTFDWNDARERLRDRSEKFIIAGGLSPENVGEAITIFHPWGVDVVSGVEESPGKKDHKKLKAFVAAVRKAESEL